MDTHTHWAWGGYWGWEDTGVGGDTGGGHILGVGGTLGVGGHWSGGNTGGEQWGWGAPTPGSLIPVDHKDRSIWDTSPPQPKTPQKGTQASASPPPPL